MEQNSIKKVLGLDLGVTSIGWAMIEEPVNGDSSKNRILGMGSRIIPLSPDENDEFTKGNALSTNAKRRMQRSARRNLQRYRLRKHLLTKVLKENEMFPDENLFKLDSVALYSLRDKAVTGRIELNELGRILFLLNQKRGYKSNRKAQNEEDKSVPKEQVEKTGRPDENEEKKPVKPGYLDMIVEREKIIAAEKLTIGQYLYKQLLSDRHFRIKENIFLRASYMDEFDRIWSEQQKYYPEVLSNSLYDRLRNQIIYFHRPLKSQKALVGKCRFETKNRTIPKSSPLFQICKIWQELNNVEIISYRGIKGVEEDQRFDKTGKRFLDIDEKQRIFQILNSAEKLTKRDLLKELGYKSGFDNYGINLQKDLEGNRTYAMTRKAFVKAGIERPDILQFNLKEETGEEASNTETGEIYQKKCISREFEKEPLYEFWHLLYSVDDTDLLIRSLVSRYQFTPAQARLLAKLDFHKAGYGNLSAKAIRNILPYLTRGAKYHEACQYAGYKHSDFLTKEENLARNLSDRLELLKKGSLRNPVVEKIINQTINLVNAILDEPELGRPDEIRVELARELKQNAEERKKTQQNITKLNSWHNEIDEKLRNEFGFSRVSHNDIERYKLWKEFGEVSPYEPGKVISLSELFDGKSYDIEHIIPRSRLFDDSFSNKTICSRALNSGESGKNRMTACDFMKTRGEAIFSEYVDFVTHAYKNGRISKTKFNRLMMPETEIPTDFINRQLAETRYITREIKGVLSQICRNVYSTSGQITSELRYLWGYDDITMDLNMKKYEEAGLTDTFTDKNGRVINRIKHWTKRDDHRHHAIDALVIACTKQSIIQRMNNLNQVSAESKPGKEGNQLRGRIEKTSLVGFIQELRPFPTEMVKQAVEGILISYKPGKRVAILNRNSYRHKKGEKPVQETFTPRGFLHKETVYGMIRRYEEVPLNTRFSRVEDVANEQLKKFLKHHLSEFNEEPGKAFSAKEVSNLIKQISDGNNIKGIREKDGKLTVTCFKREFVVRYPLSSLKAKDMSSVVDGRVKKILEERISQKGEKNAFRDLINDPVWLNREKGIQIKSVRLFTGYEGLVPLHKAIGGKTFGANKYLQGAKPVNYVITRNNHHIAIYRDQNGNLQENAVTLWDALERKKYGIPVVVKNPRSVWDYVLAKEDEKEIPSSILENLPGDSWEYITSMQQNEMFVFGLEREALEAAIMENNYSIISRNLFRVQKISQNYYVFRHHLETKVDDKKIGGEQLSKDLGRIVVVQSLGRMTGIKVRVNNIGKIEFSD